MRVRQPLNEPECHALGQHLAEAVGRAERKPWRVAIRESIRFRDAMRACGGERESVRVTGEH